MLIYIFKTDGSSLLSHEISNDTDAQNEAIERGGAFFLCTDDTYDIRDIYFDSGKIAHIPQRPSVYHVFNYTTKQWEDPRTLDDLKKAQWSTIKQALTAAEYAGFTWDGSTFDSDTLSQNRIMNHVTLAQMSPEFVIDWTLADNTVRTLIREEMVAVGIALGVHVQTQFAKAQALRVLIDAANTVEEVEAVIW